MPRILKRHKEMAKRYKAVYDELYEELPLWKKQAIEEDHERISSELANSQKELNNRYAAISSRESELESLLNNDIAKTNDALNQQLNQITREKDFIEAKFEKSIESILELLVFKTFIYLSTLRFSILQKYKKKRGYPPLFYIKF